MPSVKVRLTGEHRQLEQEIDLQLKAIPQGRLTSPSKKARERVLGVELVLQWILDHPGEAYGIARTVVDVIRLAIRKLAPPPKKKGKKAPKLVRVEVEGKVLELPASDSTVQKFLKEVSGSAADPLVSGACGKQSQDSAGKTGRRRRPATS